MRGLNVLLFHLLHPEPPMPSAVRPDVFTRTLDLVVEAGADVRTLTGFDAVRPTGSGRPAICLTFDDGWESDARIALPDLLRRGLCATFFVITDKMGTAGFMPWAEVRELAEAGMEVGSHSRSHPNLTGLAPRALDGELRGSRELLEDRLGVPVTSLSIPHGFYSHAVLAAAAAAGYRRVCASRPGVTPLPLRAGAPLRRNALHRLLVPADLPRLIWPGRVTLASREVGYAGRALLKRLLPGSRYEAFRRWALSHVVRSR